MTNSISFAIHQRQDSLLFRITLVTNEPSGTLKELDAMLMNHSICPVSLNQILYNLHFIYSVPRYFFHLPGHTCISFFLFFRLKFHYIFFFFFQVPSVCLSV
uniref:Putative ovule protein n=1 Tax=Solanum chacoense TaxID=4108 RepID=A0A0V0GZD2_SOLCH